MENIELRLAEVEKKIDAMTVVVKRLYMIFLIATILTVISIVIPAIGLIFALPKLMASYSAALGI